MYFHGISTSFKKISLAVAVMFYIYYDLIVFIFYFSTCSYGQCCSELSNDSCSTSSYEIYHIHFNSSHGPPLCHLLVLLPDCLILYFSQIVDILH